MMYGKSLARVILGALLSIIATFATADEQSAEKSISAPAPLDLYGRLPTLEDVSLSPDGARIAYLRTKGDDRIIYITSLADHKSLRALRVGTVKLKGFMWGDNNCLLIVTSIDNKLPSLQVLNVERGETIGRLNNVIGMPVLRKVSGKTLVFVMGAATFLFNGGEPGSALYRLSLADGKQSMVACGPLNFTRWFVDKDGEMLAFETYNAYLHLYKLKLRTDNRIVTLKSEEEGLEHSELSGLAPDGSALWLSTVENGEFLWKSVALKDGVVSGPLVETNGFKSLIKDPYSGRIIGGFLSKASGNIEFFDNHLRETWNVVEHLFPDEHVDLVSASEGFKKIVLLIDGPRHGLAYMLFDTDTFAVEPLGQAYDGLSQYAQVLSMRYPASDGFEIPAFVTLPPHRDAKNLPLVVLPHDGPVYSDTGRFDWLAQALATRGYAVLQANYRGSDLGWKFMSAGFGEWGHRMQTDLSDGVRALAKQGLIDPTRVCIVGTGYGGYTALAGASLDVGVYRCTVSFAGISDIKKYMKWLDPRLISQGNTSTRYINRYLGAEQSYDPVIKARSPLQQAAHITIPILLIHGRDDSIVPYEQSESMVRALNKLGKPVELITLDKEDHWLSHSDTRLQMLQATVKFLLDNNPPD